MFTVVLGNPPYHIEGNRTKYKCYHFFIEQAKLLLSRFTNLLIPAGLFNNNESSISKEYLNEIRGCKSFDVIRYYSSFDKESPFYDEIFEFDCLWFLMVNGLDDKQHKDITCIKTDKGEFTVTTLQSFSNGSLVFNIDINQVLDKIRKVDGDFTSCKNIENILDKDIRMNTLNPVRIIKLDENEKDLRGGVKVYLTTTGKRKLNCKTIDKDNGLPYIYMNKSFDDDKFKISLKRCNHYRLVIYYRQSDYHNPCFYVIEPNSIVYSGFCTTNNLIVNKDELQNLQKYLLTTFAKALLLAKDCKNQFSRSKFRFIPLQDFTNNSDIEWNQDIEGINQQLYKKYNLSKTDIEAIENFYSSQVK